MKRIKWARILIFLLMGLGSSGAMASNPRQASPCPNGYSDLPTNSIFYPYAHCLACAGVVKGYADGSFHSGESVTRGEMSRWIALVAGYNDAIPANQQTFVDVPATDPNWLYIEQLNKHRIITGYPCGPSPDGTAPPGGPCPGQYFHPEHLITRAQTAKIVTLAAGFTDPIAPNTQTFKEVPLNHPYWLFVERAVAHGLVSGYDCDNSTFNICGAKFGVTIERCPGPYYRCCANVTRSQATKIIALAFYPGCSTP